MSDKTKIEWSDATWNPITGCSKVSQGCLNCYALRDWDKLSKQEGSVYYGREFTDIQEHPERLSQPSRWTKPRKIFVNSMSDLFHEQVSYEFIANVFKVMEQNPHHTFQVLTKRPGIMASLLTKWAESNKYTSKLVGLPNVWLGTSVEDQTTWNSRVSLLMDVPTAYRWVSMEPLLGPVDLTGGGLFSEHLLRMIDWIVIGGESGPDARPMHPDWVRNIVNQCREFGISVLFKQWGEWGPELDVDFCSQSVFITPNGIISDYKEGVIVQTSNVAVMHRNGKQHNSRVLDGQTYVMYPDDEWLDVEAETMIGKIKECKHKLKSPGCSITDSEYIPTAGNQYYARGGNRESVCTWNLTVRFFTKEQCQGVIKELMEQEVNYDFEYECEAGDSLTPDNHYITIKSMSWASNLEVVSSILKKYDHHIA